MQPALGWEHIRQRVSRAAPDVEQELRVLPGALGDQEMCDLILQDRAVGGAPHTHRDRGAREVSQRYVWSSEPAGIPHAGPVYGSSQRRSCLYWMYPMLRSLFRVSSSTRPESGTIAASLATMKSSLARYRRATSGSI